MRFRLRYLQHDVELVDGLFVVGRNDSCQLSVDDPLVSRRHAQLECRDGMVTLVDLGSRNGTLVNGQRIESKVTLHEGDRIGLGSQELTIVVAREPAQSSTTGHVGKLTVPQMRVEDVPPAEESSTSSDADREPSVIRRLDQFKLLSSVAEKSLALGKAAEAERLLASALGDVIEATRGRRPLPPSLVDQAAKYSAKLASATGKGGWADYVIELYAAQNRPCPAPVIDELYTAFRRVTSVDLPRLRAYIEALRGNVDRYGPAERFLLQRLEGLERLGSLR